MAIPRRITFMEDSDSGQNKGILKAFYAKMPSFCPKLESFIKVMHRRKAKNDQKFTKFCFSRDLSLKSGKINFHEFWTIFGHSTVHHLKKTPKNIRKIDLRKKNISPKKRKMADFFSAKGHKFHKNGQKFKIFLFHNVLCSQWHRKNFLWSLEPYSRNELQNADSWKKKPFLLKSRWG